MVKSRFWVFLFTSETFSDIIIPAGVFMFLPQTDRAQFVLLYLLYLLISRILPELVTTLGMSIILVL